MTNLGVLWLGTAKQRSRICYPITVEYIVYDDLENKTNKLEWRDNSLNPKELLEDIMGKAVELTYSYEMPTSKSDIHQDKIFAAQLKDYVNTKECKVSVLNAFPLFFV